MTTLLLIAKAPLPGRAKTRLHPPLTLAQAARIAELSLAQTIETANALPVDERVLAWTGGPVPAGVGGWRVVAQSDGDLDARLGAAFDACEGPTVLLGMDTPQVTADDLALALDPAGWDGALLGPATDGGFWSLALAEPDGELLRGIPMSRSDTGARQLERLQDAGLPVRMLPELRDIDTIEDARAVAATMPGSALAAALTEFERGAA